MASSVSACTSLGVLVASSWSVVGLSLSPVFLPAQVSEVIRAFCMHSTVDLWLDTCLWDGNNCTCCSRGGSKGISMDG